MDHSEAVEKQAPERYLLNEMAIEDREAFEEHFFDCPECAADLRGESALIAGVRLRRIQRQPRQWAVWSSAAAAAVLAFVVGYQNLTPVFQQARVLHPPSQALSTSLFRSGQGEQKVASLYGDVVTVDIDEVKGATGYTVEVVDSRGSSRASQFVTVDAAATTVYLLPARKLPSGSYILKVKPEGAGQPSSVPFVVR